MGEALAAHPDLPLVSATGSVRMGRAVAQTVAARLGRSLLELGGNKLRGLYNIVLKSIGAARKRDPAVRLDGAIATATGTDGNATATATGTLS